jgi:hypothetical protein
MKPKKNILTVIDVKLCLRCHAESIYSFKIKTLKQNRESTFENNVWIICF